MAKKDEEKKSQNSSAIQAQIKKRDAAQKQLDERDARLKAKKEEKWGLDPEDKRFDERGLPVPPGQNNKPKPPAPKKETGGFGSGSAKTRNGQANVSKEQLNKSGLTLNQYMNQWNKTGKRPTKSSGTDDKPAKKSFRQRRADKLKERIASDSGTEGQKRRQRRRLARVEKRMARNKDDGGESQKPFLEKKLSDKTIPDKYKPKGYYQGGEARLDESLGERRGKESSKSQSMKSRRNESRGATKKSTPKSAGAATRGWGAVMR